MRGLYVPRALVQGRTAISFFTTFTPLTFQVRLSAVLFSVAFLAKPDSITVPFRVSTLIAAASTRVLSTKLVFTAVVMALSSM